MNMTFYNDPTYIPLFFPVGSQWILDIEPMTLLHKNQAHIGTVINIDLDLESGFIITIKNNETEEIMDYRADGTPLEITSPHIFTRVDFLPYIKKDQSWITRDKFKHPGEQNDLIQRVYNITQIEEAGTYPVIAKETEETNRNEIQTYTRHGRFLSSAVSPYDLFIPNLPTNKYKKINKKLIPTPTYKSPQGLRCKECHLLIDIGHSDTCSQR